MENFSPDAEHFEILKNLKPKFAFNPENDYFTWKNELKNKLTELLGDMPQEKVDPKPVIEITNETEKYIEKRIIINVEPHIQMPMYMRIPKKASLPCPVVICLQGHSTGAHISLGKVKYPGDAATAFDGDRDFANQIVDNGYIALAVEQRAFGERKSSVNIYNNSTTCLFPSLTAMLIGRTLLGERVYDISRAIDFLETQPEADASKIACMGNSGGGTATFYAACMDERIKVAMPSCSVCTYRDSIGAMHHCSCNYIPNAAKYFDMGDLSCLIAPRPLIVIAGKDDHIFPINGVHQTFDIIQQIYAKEQAPNNCRLIIGEGGHRFYANQAWPVFNLLSGWNN